MLEIPSVWESYNNTRASVGIFIVFIWECTIAISRAYDLCEKPPMKSQNYVCQMPSVNDSLSAIVTYLSAHERMSFVSFLVALPLLSAFIWKRKEIHSLMFT